MTRSARDRLADIATAIAKVYDFRASLGSRYSAMAISAILREIGRHRGSGERPARRHYRQTARDRLRQIAAMRNFLVHEYFNIDQAVLEDVITNDLDPLSAAVTALLDTTEEDPQGN